MPTVESYTTTYIDGLFEDLPYFVANRLTDISYTLILSDASKLIEMDSSTSNTLTVPLDEDVAFPVGTTIEVVQRGDGVTTIAGDVGVTINSLDDALESAGKFARIKLEKIDTDEWYASGDLVVAP
jgi:hypothetical protein